MRIQHNVMAMNAYRNYSNNTKALSKNLERLSSGYKINRAGDDAAGLAISEKMRAQITGLEAAQKNVKDGISLVNTAEGAMQEVQDMLNRMVYLAQESANGTYDNEVDRLNLQKEMDQLNSEIDRIADSANFNGIKLLDGSLGFNKEAFNVTGTTDGVTGATLTDMIETDMASVGAAVGTNTILHEDGVSAQLGSFAVDLSQLRATGNAAADVPTVNLTIQGLGTPIAITGTAGSELTGAQIADKLKDATSGNNYLIIKSDGTVSVGAANTIDKGGIAYQAQTSADGVVTFKAVGYGSAATTFTAFTDSNLDKLSEVNDNAVATTKHISGPVTAAAGANTALAGAQNIATTATVDTIKPSAAKFGNTFLTVHGDKITEGMKITIAGETHTFSDDDIKISDLDVTTANGEKDLLERIAKAFEGNQHVSVGTDATNQGRLTLAERTDGKGTAAKSLASEEYQKKMSSLDGFKSMVSFNAADTKAATNMTVDPTKIKEGDGVTVGDKTYIFTDKADLKGTSTGKVQYLDKSNAAAELATALTADGYKTTATGNNLVIEAKAGTTEAPTVLGKGLTLQIGDTSDPYNQLSVVIGDIHAAKLGTAALSIADQQSAADAVDKIKAAINTISGIRGTLGATSNRLDHTANNLSVMRENITDAESSIRDTDIAEEMMSYTKNNILVQSAQAMLAQANQVPQGVLQLLQ